jgi:putative spermidine/putrescine transport system permease protein
MTVKSAQQGSTRSKSAWRWLVFLPFFGFGLIFEVVPIITVVASSLHNKAGTLSLANYQRVLSPMLLESFANSLRLSAITAALGVILGTVIAWAIINVRTGLLGEVTTALADVATNFGGAPLAFAFIVTLGSTGVVTLVLQRFFGINLYPNFRIYSVSGLVLAYLYFQMPLMVLLIQPSLLGLKKEWREAALNLGANELHYWLLVALPLLSPSLIGGFLLLFANSFGAYATAWTLTGPDINLVTIQIAALIRGEVQLEPGIADAMATISLLIMAVCVIGYQWANARSERWRA